MQETLREALVITFWTGWTMAALALVLALAAGVPFGITFLLGILTVGPTLAIWRGRDREKDPLTLGQRAAAEALALVVLLVLGTYISHAMG